MYNGIIKKSRTLDLVALGTVVDGAGLGFLAYSPEQWGLTIPVYAAIRMALNGLSAWIRFKTSGPVGVK